ncbi:MAG TPA: AbrB/MazE/SpoVT family DNA-binding domain-containing protein [Vicinamibacterales bacterium]|nr:AbrB/MazE/SpoVT family DNA-binding domain-containing protein [Vicinamibacterales bacterium]
MVRKIVQTGSSLAVTLPREIVEELELKKGDEVEVTIHPQTGAIVIRAGVKYFDDGKVTKRFKEASRRVVEKYKDAFRELAK